MRLFPRGTSTVKQPRPPPMNYISDSPRRHTSSPSLTTSRDPETNSRQYREWESSFYVACESRYIHCIQYMYMSTPNSVRVYPDLTPRQRQKKKQQTPEANSLKTSDPAVAFNWPYAKSTYIHVGTVCM